MQLELLNMGKSGELKQLWDVAAVTNIRINMVRACPTGLLHRERSLQGSEQDTHAPCCDSCAINIPGNFCRFSACA